MKKFFYFLCLVIIIIFPKNVLGDKINKIVFIDIDYLLNNTVIGKQTLQKLEKFNNEDVKYLKDKESLLINKENEIKKKQNILSENELKKEIDNLKLQISKFREEKKIIIQKSEKNKIDELNKVINQFNEIIKEYMAENAIDIVLNKKNIFIGKVSSDITQDVLKKINNEIK